VDTTQPRRHRPGAQSGSRSPRRPEIGAKIHRLRPGGDVATGREHPVSPGALAQDVTDTALRQVEEQRRQLEARIQEVNELDSRIRGLTRDLQDQSQAKREQQEAHDRERNMLSERIEELTSALRHMESRCQELEEHSTGIEKINAILREAVLSDTGVYQRRIAARTRDVTELAEEFEALRTNVMQAGGSLPANVATDAATAESPQHRIEDTAVPEDAGTRPQGDGTDRGITRTDTEQLDMLTGLYNRRHFIEVLGEQLAQEHTSRTHQSVYYVLLDNFAQIRKDIGFLNSDIVLQEISGLLKSHFNDADVIAHFGDNTFSILHNSDSVEEITDTAERLRELVESHVAKAGGHCVIITASIGICILNEYTNNVDDILTRADLACEVARTSDGNRVHVHSTIIDEQIDHGNEENWDNVVRKTLDDQRFYLSYQPIVSLNNGPGQRYEVLLRILDEDGNVVFPGQFLSVAERIGLAVDIDRYVIENAFRAIGEGNNKDLQLYIKLSHAAITDTGLPLWIDKKRQQYGVVGDQAVFEVPEHVVGKDLGNTARLARALHDGGCLVAIEHCKGVTRTQHLAHIRADILKIDGTLIGELGKSRDNHAGINAIVALARQSGMMVVAERVEEAAGLALLWENGIQYAQGNFIQEPSRKLDYDFDGEIVSADVDEGRAIFAPASRPA
ncbi:MAG: EAL domain-containing protein, partial [Gammaproteobacteria bacterium]|jgi:diguanylate cyclase (GGDEF)-like protein